MKKKIAACVLAFATLMSSAMQAQAQYYKPGGVKYTLEKEDSTASNGVEMDSNGALTVGPSGGSVQYDLLIPFPVKSLEFHYQADARVKIAGEVGAAPFEIVLNNAENSRIYDFPTTIHEGDHIIRLSFNGAVTISSITIHEAPRPRGSTYNPDLPALSADEKMIHSAVIVREGASAIMVNGATRYIDNQNIDEKPVYIDGNLCLPIHALCRALGYYYEDKAELSYTLMRYNKDEYVVRDGVKTKETNFRKIENADFPLYHKDGKTYAGIFYFAEAIGKTVASSDGYVFIDYRNVVKDILKSPSTLGHVRKVLEPFMADVKTGSTYYVSQSEKASDDNPGTITAPFRTLNKAGEAAKAGDTVIVGAGTYREVFKPKHDGTAKSPIIFMAAEGEKVVISATEVIDDFGALEDGKVSAKLPADLGYGFNQIFYRGDCIVEARYPNGPAFEVAEGQEPLSPLFATNGDFKVNDEDGHLVESASGLLDQEEPDVWKDALYVSMHGNGYSLCQARVGSSEKGKLRLAEVTKRYWWNPGFNFLWDFGYLQGTEACMDLPGEWIARGNILIMIPPVGETAETLVVEAKARKMVVDLDGRKFVHIKGIDTFGGSITMDEAEMCMLDNMDIKYISHFTWNDDQSSGYIDDYSKRDTAGAQGIRKEVGIYVGGKNNMILNNDLAYSAGCGLLLCGLYPYIENNYIDSCGYGGAMYGGILVGMDLSKDPAHPNGGFALYENTIRRAGRGLVHCARPDSLAKFDKSRPVVLPYEIAYNNFHDGILYSLDAGITYIYGTRACTDRLYSRYHHNYVYYTMPYCNPYSFGIYHDGDSEGVTTYENVVFTTREDTMFTSGGVFAHLEVTPNHLWNNMDISTPVAGPGSLLINQFPNNKPFYAGLARDKASFMMNYEAQPEAYVRLASESAVLGEGTVVTERGTLKYTKDGSYVEYRNVDFGPEGASHATIYFSGDRNKLAPSTLAIRTGDSYEKSARTLVLLKSKANSLTDLDNATTNIAPVSGMTNVYIELEQIKDPAFELDNIVFDNLSTKSEGHDGALVYGGNFDIADAVGDLYKPPLKQTGGGYAESPYANEVWSGSKIRFKNVRVPEKANVFYLNAGIRAPWDGMEIVFEYNIEGAAGRKEIARFRTVNNGWMTDGDTQYYVLDEPINGDVIDIYVAFGTKEDGTSGTCNFFSFGFTDSVPEATAKK